LAGVHFYGIASGVNVNRAATFPKLYLSVTTSGLQGAVYITGIYDGLLGVK